MPVAVPLIASVAAAAALPATFTVFGLSIAASAALVSGAVGLGASLIMGAVNRPKSPDVSGAFNQAGAGRTQQFRQPIAPHQVIFGRTKVSGPILFVHSAEDDFGRTFGDFYMIHGLSGVKVRAIRTVYLGEDLSSLAIYQTAGALARITKHLGESDQTADSNFVAEIPSAWSTGHRLRGRAYLSTRLTWDPEAYRDGVPNVSAIVEGVDTVYDPRTAATAWTNNAALCIAKWFTADFGMGLAWADLDEDSVIAAANVCDERVLVASGSATFTVDAGSPSTGDLTLSDDARKLDIGDGVRLSTSGTLPGGFAAATTYYVICSDDEKIKLASSLANAIAGTPILPSSSGTGTQTLTYYDEARYKLNGTFTLDAAKGDVLEQMLSAMAGVAAYIGGKWFLHAGAASTPTITLTEDDLRGDLTFIPKRSMRDRFNGVRAVYVNPDANWQPVDAPPLQSATYLAQDSSEELYEDIRYPFTTSTRAVQRMMKVALERNRQQGIVQFPAKLTAMRLQPWDGVYLTIERYGWTQKQFRVIGWQLSEDGGVDLTLQEDAASVYTWASSEESAAAFQQGITAPNASSITAPSSVTVTTPTTPTYSQVLAAWSEVLNIYLGRYDVEYRAAGGSDWTSYGAVGEDAAREAQIERTAATDVRVRAVTTNGTQSAFTQNLAPGAPTSPAAVGDVGQIDLSWTNAADADYVQIFVNTADTLSGATLLHSTSGSPATPVTSYSHTGLGGAQTRYYWLRSVNSGGNVSAETASVNATTS